MTDPRIPEGAIAIVGMSGRFPGADDVDAFWRNLREGRESIARLDDAVLEAAGVRRSLLENPHFVKAEAVLDRMEYFDAGFFGMSPKDAAIMDPQVRHILECAWHALEHAGHVPERFGGSVGVFAGCGVSSYFWQNVLANDELRDSVGFFLLRHTGNDKDFLSTRISYEFDLKGPSVGIQTACSTSLVAIHYACQSLLSWECDMALAGGVTINQPHGRGYVYQEGEILSPDGHCRSFDHEARGTVFGSGVGVVVLRRLEEALEDGDTIHAVIRGSAVNNDGSGKVSYLAPSVDGQAKAIAEAVSVAGVEADSIGFVEGHGTATPIGDPIEVAALTQAFRTQTEKTGFCALGSVKSNIGHLDTAAGVASLIKVVQALKHGEIPPTVHFAAPNPQLELPSTPFFINSETIPWPSVGERRRAGVSSLGVGGTNAHVVLEEAPAQRPAGEGRLWHLLPVSGRSRGVVEAASRNLVEHLEEHPDEALADVSYTLRQGRKAFDYRRAVVCRSAEEAIDVLATGQGERLVDGVAKVRAREVVFLFAGGGAQYPDMGRALYEQEPVYREAVDRLLTHFDREADFDLRALLYPDAESVDESGKSLQRPSRALPALFITQYAHARLWMSWGIEPSSMIGHSMGEYTAACLAGVFSPEEALSLVGLRGRLFETVPPGAMTSVNVGVEVVEPHLGPELSIAAVNAPELTLVAGPVGAIEALESRLAGLEIDTRRVRIDVAAHSAMLEPILEEFGKYVGGLRLSEPERPFVSNLTGAPVQPGEVTTAEYWVRHLRETVRFGSGLSSLLAPDGPVLLEVGPGRTLATLAKLHPERTPEQPIAHSLPHPDEIGDAQAFHLTALGQIWAHGVDIDWSLFDAGFANRRTPLPGYPFEREPYFIEAPAPREAREGSPGTSADASKGSDREADVSRWFYRRRWSPADAPAARELSGKRVLVLADEDSRGTALADELGRRGATVLRVRAGEAFREISEGAFELSPGSRPDWDDLARTLHSAALMPDVVIHAWSLDSSGDNAAADDLEARAFYAPLRLFQAFESTAPGLAMDFVALSTGFRDADAGAPPEPTHALLLGPVRVVPREIPSVRARLIDAAPSVDLARIVDEIASTAAEPVVALTRAERLVESFERTPVAAAGTDDRVVRDGGVCLITGGLGGIGLVIARTMAARAKVRLALVGRSGLPAAEAREAWLREHPATDKTSRAIREVQALEAMGAEVEVYAADVTDPSAVDNLVATVQRRFGAIDGVVHAAGVLDDGPLLARADEQIRSVLEPKVRGAKELDRALAQVGIEPTFFAVFSSSSSVVGAAGQLDYTAANAFLDAFAEARSERARGRTVSIGWGPWRDVGMAAELTGTDRYDEDVLAEGGGTRLEHHLFDTRAGASGEFRFRARFEVGSHWMLDEHRVKDSGWVLPGSGYVELVHAAYREAVGQPPALLRDLVFLRPFGVTREEPREMEVRLSADGEGFETVVRGRRNENDAWVEHARAWVGGVPGEHESAVATSFQEVRGRFDAPTSDGRGPHPFMDFGPRWNNVTGSTAQGREALLELALPDHFHDDLGSFHLHPALMDTATAGAQDLIEELDRGEGALVPVGYGTVRVHGALPPRMTSHVVLKEVDDEASFASFDVRIYGEAGALVAEISDFSMMRVTQDQLSEGESGSGAPGWLQNAIGPRDGGEAFLRIAESDISGHILVSPRPLGVVIAEAGEASSGAAARRGTRKVVPQVDVRPVEAALEEHEAVAEAAVLAAPDVGGGVRLVAFVAFEAGLHATVSEIRRHVRKLVPPESVPKNFVELPELPRDAGGRLLRSELRDPFAEVDDYVAPRTPTEEALAAIWQDLLGLDRISVHDNFLDVGGHSLVGIRAIVRTEKETGIRLHANALTLQTLAQIAEDIEKKGGGAKTASVSEGTGPEPAPEVAKKADDAPADEDDGGFLSRVKKVIVGR